MMCPSSLHVMEVSKTCLLIGLLVFVTFLKIGTIKVSFQVLGIKPESSGRCWKSCVRAGASSVAAVLK